MRLTEAVKRTGNSVCVGLDPRAESLPRELLADPKACFKTIADAYEKFACRIIDVVADLVPIVKPQAAFFEALGPAGCLALCNVNRYAQERGLLVVLDAKRGDIGSTAEAYAEAYLTGFASAWHCDALTVNPFLGDDTLEPFVQSCGRFGTGIFVLAKTSNPGSGFVQQARLDGEEVSTRIARWIEASNHPSIIETGAKYGSIGAVVGATYPAQLETLRRQMPSAWLLIPGYGAQGGKASDLRAAWDDNGLGAIVNNSRGIIFAYQKSTVTGHDWTAPVRAATLAMIADLGM